MILSETNSEKNHTKKCYLMYKNMTTFDIKKIMKVEVIVLEANLELGKYSSLKVEYADF